MTIFWVIVLFSILILAHEGGHFLTARLFGVKVEEFGIGYPPRLVGVYRDPVSRKWKIVWGHPRKGRGKEKSSATIYSLNLIPFGGFVRLFGEDREKEALKEKNSFAAQKPGKRSIIILGGVAMNVVLAAIFLIIMFSIGAPVASDADIGQGTLENQRVVVTQVIKDSPAEKVGLQMGDVVLKIKEKGTERWQIIKKEDDLANFTSQHQGKEIVLILRRGEETIEKEVKLGTKKGEKAPLGVSIMRIGTVRYPWYRAIYQGIITTFHLLGMIVVGFGKLIKHLIFSGKLIGEVAGPVGLFTLSAQAFHMGVSSFLYFAAVISLNLCILNALPFPALDGGRFMFIIIEKLRGKPVSAELEKKIHAAGFILLLLLVLAVTAKDIKKLF